MTMDPTGKEGHCISDEKSTSPAAQPVRTCPRPEVLLLPGGIQVRTAPCGILLCWTSWWLCYSLHVPICSSLLFPNKDILGAKYWWFLGQQESPVGTGSLGEAGKKEAGRPSYLGPQELN